MKLHSIHKTLILPVSITDAWEFFSQPGNLEKITPDWMRFRIQSGLPESMYAGLIISYRITLLPGITSNWVTEITQVVHGKMFVDEQRFGPYKFWHHQHHFNETEKGTRVEDIVHYAMPVGIIGEFAHRMIVRNRLKEIFAFRESSLRQRFGVKN